MKKLLKMKLTVILILICAFGTVLKKNEKIGYQRKKRGNSNSDSIEEISWNT